MGQSLNVISLPDPAGTSVAAIISSFNREGFAAVRLTEWREDHNHRHQNVVQPPPGSSDPVLGDLPEFVDFNYVAKVARLNAAVLATPAGLAGRTGQGLDRHPEAGKWDRVDLGSGSR